MGQHDLVEQFLAITRETFKFLETDYGFAEQDSQRGNTEDIRDAEAAVIYAGNKVGVRVFWYFAGAFIGVGLVEARDGRFPETVYYSGDKRPAGVALRSLVSVLYPNATKEFALQGDVTSGRNIVHRQQLINADMNGVIRNAAELTRKYASGVLMGDTSIITKVRAQLHA